jgi:hypothetical protein
MTLATSGRKYCTCARATSRAIRAFKLTGTLTFGMLTLFYFIRAGSFVSVTDLLALRSCSWRC